MPLTGLDLLYGVELDIDKTIELVYDAVVDIPSFQDDKDVVEFLYEVKENIEETKYSKKNQRVTYAIYTTAFYNRNFDVIAKIINKKYNLQNDFVVIVSGDHNNEKIVFGEHIGSIGLQYKKAPEYESINPITPSDEEFAQILELDICKNNELKMHVIAIDCDCCS